MFSRMTVYWVQQKKKKKAWEGYNTVYKPTLMVNNRVQDHLKNFLITQTD